MEKQIRRQIIEAEIIEETPVNPMEHMANMQEEHDNYNSPQSAWERLENIHGKIDIITLRNLFIKALKENEDSVGLGKYLEFHNKIKLTEVSKIILDENGIFKNSDDILSEVEDNPKIGLALENLNSDNPNKNDVKLEHSDFILFSYIGMAKLVEGENIYNWIDKTLYEKDRQPKIGFFKALGGQVRALASGVRQKTASAIESTKTKTNLAIESAKNRTNLAINRVKNTKLALSETSKYLENNPKNSRELAFNWLMIGISQGDYKKVEQAINNGADVNGNDNYHNTPLTSACYKPNHKIVELLLKNGAKVNMRNDNGYLPLHFAAGSGNIETIKILIKYGVNLFLKDCDDKLAVDWAIEDDMKETAEFLKQEMDKQNQKFLRAVANNDLEEVKKLIKQGVDINTKDEKGFTALSHACLITKNIEMIELLIDNGADIDTKTNEGNTPLISACYFGNNDVVDCLVSNGANIYIENDGGHNAKKTAEIILNNEAIEIIENRKEKITKKLIKAVKAGNVDKVKKLISAGGDVNAKDADGNSILMIAAIDKNKCDILEILLDNDADTELRNEKGVTPLMTAAHFGNSEGVMILMNYGADIFAQKDGNYATWYGEIEGYFDIRDMLNRAMTNARNEATADLIKHVRNNDYDKVEQAIKNKANINIKDKYGRTALMQNRSIEIMELLLKNKPDVDMQDDIGNTALIYNCLLGNYEKADLLLTYGANPDIKNENGFTALMRAAENGNAKIVERLIYFGANVSIKNNDGQTALDLAKLSKNKEVIKILEQATIQKNKKIARQAAILTQLVRD